MRKLVNQGSGTGDIVMYEVYREPTPGQKNREGWDIAKNLWVDFSPDKRFQVDCFPS